MVALPSKPCRKCGEVKPPDRYYRHPTTRDGRQSWCKACSNESVNRGRNTPEGKRRARDLIRRPRAALVHAEVEREKAEAALDEIDRKARHGCLGRRCDACDGGEAGDGC